MATELKAPFPYFFGGKSTVAADVWQRFGLPDTYVEPFCGSAAVLLGSPHWPHGRVVETINDASGWIVNVWRAIQADPKEVARWADAPVFECVPAGTMVSTALGDVAIEDIKPGDTVLGEKDGKIVESRVVARSVSLADEFYTVGRLRLTGNHPVWTAEHGYVPAMALFNTSGETKYTVAVADPICVTGGTAIQYAHGNTRHQQPILGNLHTKRPGDKGSQVHRGYVSRKGAVQGAFVKSETWQSDILLKLDKKRDERRRPSGIQRNTIRDWRFVDSGREVLDSVIQESWTEANEPVRRWRGNAWIYPTARAKGKMVATEEGNKLRAWANIWNAWKKAHSGGRGENTPVFVREDAFGWCEEENIGGTKAEANSRGTKREDGFCRVSDKAATGEKGSRAHQEAPSLQAVYLPGNARGFSFYQAVGREDGHEQEFRSQPSEERREIEVGHYASVLTRVYNIETTAGNYFADGVLVHNCDLHAKHAWLMGQRSQLVERLEGDPDYFDAKVAGWWVWGASCWIGQGWCSGNGPWSVEEDEEGCRVLTKNDAEAGARRKVPYLRSGGQGVNRQLPDLTSAGRGALSRQVPYLKSAGQGVNRQMPEMHSARGVVKSSMADDRTAGLVAWMQDLSARLRDVRVLCGDWKRAVTPAVTTYHGTAAVFLDPPYNDDERTPDLYTEDSGTVATEVRQWCLENGDNPNYRLALCGYAGEHDELDDAGWERFEWKANGGYGNQGKKTSRGRDNATREVIWFNKSCVRPEAVQVGLF